MRNTIFVFKKKKFFYIIASTFLSVFLLVGIFGSVFVFSPKPIYTIVIDAGHGGKDGGAVGKTTGVSESFLNLEYAKTLKRICESNGFKVIMTRSDMGGLYSPFASNKKRSEMEKRESIIKNSNADLVVSIHMNSFSSADVKGSQVYFAMDSEIGEDFAQKIQTELHNSVENAKAKAKKGDFYILNCTSKPSVLVECGYLSNPDEEKLLQQEEYKQKFCYSLFCGIVRFCSFN